MTTTPPFNVSVALEVLSTSIVDEIRDGAITGFNISWDGGPRISVEKTIKVMVEEATKISFDHTIIT